MVEDVSHIGPSTVNIQIEVGHRQRQSLSGCACSNPATTTDPSVVCRSARSNLTLRPPPRMDQDRLTKIKAQRMAKTAELAPMRSR